MSPKDPCVKGLFPRVVLLGDCGTFKRGALAEGLQVIEGMHLFFLLPVHEVKSFAHSHYDVLPQAKNYGAKLS
jgi:hypothetical protein